MCFQNSQVSTGMRNIRNRMCSAMDGCPARVNAEVIKDRWRVFPGCPLGTSRFSPLDFEIYPRAVLRRGVSLDQQGCFRRSSGFQLKLTANSRGLLRVTCARRVRPRILKSNWAGSPNTDSTESFAPVSERSTTPHTTDLPVANRICAVASVSVRAEALRSPADWVVRFPNTIRSGCSQTALRKLPRASKRLFLRSLSCLPRPILRAGEAALVNYNHLDVESFRCPTGRDTARRRV